MHLAHARVLLVATVLAGCSDPMEHRDATVDSGSLDATDVPLDARRDALDAPTDMPVSEPPMCRSPADCPGVNTSCASRLCTVGQCVSEPVPVGTALAAREQVAGDCQTLECDGVGNARGRTDDADPPDDRNDCTIDTCLGGTEQFAPRAAHTPCATGVCTGSGTGVGCLDGTDCAAGDACFHARCITPGCGNGAREAGEQCDDGNRTPGDGCS
ncbi:MAG: hypothetical protein WCJ30_14010, partial [Deltaproteobacteria bacterium]